MIRQCTRHHSHSPHRSRSPRRDVNALHYPRRRVLRRVVRGAPNAWSRCTILWLVGNRRQLSASRDTSRNVSDGHRDAELCSYRRMQCFHRGWVCTFREVRRMCGVVQRFDLLLEHVIELRVHPGPRLIRRAWLRGTSSHTMMGDRSAIRGLAFS